MRNIVTCGRYLCIAEGKKKDTIPVSNLWMVSFFWNGLHAIQVVLHYIKQVAGLQIFLLHQSSQSFCDLAESRILASEGLFKIGSVSGNGSDNSFG